MYDFSCDTHPELTRLHHVLRGALVNLSTGQTVVSRDLESIMDEFSPVNNQLNAHRQCCAVECMLTWLQLFQMHARCEVTLHAHDRLLT